MEQVGAAQSKWQSWDLEPGQGPELCWQVQPHSSRREKSLVLSAPPAISLCPPLLLKRQGQDPGASSVDQ